MKRILTSTLLISALAVSACTNPDRFGADGMGGAGANAGAGVNSGVVPGSANDPSLTDVGRATLDGQVAWLQTNTDYQAVIEGHADEQGTREYNIALGGRRANAVREYMISRGIAASRLKTISYGKERPIEICSEEACYAKNRRAVTVLAGGALTS